MIRIFFAFSFLLFSCSKERDYTRSNLSYLALGDSYTIGESINIKDSYPNQLKDQIDLIDSLTYLIPSSQDLIRSFPHERYVAIAEDNVQPVP